MGALIGQLLTALGGEAAKALLTKAMEWWKSEGKLLFVGWYQKRAGRQEQAMVDRARQLEREAEEVSRANASIHTIEADSLRRADSGDPPLWGVRKPK